MFKFILHTNAHMHVDMIICKYVNTYSVYTLTSIHVFEIYYFNNTFQRSMKIH